MLFKNGKQIGTKINVLGKEIKSKKEMKVLGIIFDEKMSWNTHINTVIEKAKRNLYAIRRLKNYLNNEETMFVARSTLYSITYYGAQAFLTPLSGEANF